MRIRTAAVTALLVASTGIAGCRYGHPGHDSDRHGRRGSSQDGGSGARSGDNQRDENRPH